MNDSGEKSLEEFLANEDPRVRGAELLISGLLRAGVTSSLIVIIAGLAVSFTRHHDYFSDPAQLGHLTRPGAAFPRTITDTLIGIRQGRGQAIISAGLLLLIATPMMRVAISIVSFAYQRDRTFVLITSIVLALLILSFVVGRAGE